MVGKDILRPLHIFNVFEPTLVIKSVFLKQVHILQKRYINNSNLFLKTFPQPNIYDNEDLFPGFQHHQEASKYFWYTITKTKLPFIHIKGGLTGNH